MEQLRAEVVAALEEALLTVSPELDSSERRQEAEEMVDAMSKVDILAILSE